MLLEELYHSTSSRNDSNSTQRCKNLASCTLNLNFDAFCSIQGTNMMNTSKLVWPVIRSSLKLYWQFYNDLHACRLGEACIGNGLYSAICVLMTTSVPKSVSTFNFNFVLILVKTHNQKWKIFFGTEGVFPYRPNNETSDKNFARMSNLDESTQFFKH